MEGILLYSAIISICYLLFISIGKINYEIDELAYRLLIFLISFEMIMMWLFKTGYIVEVPHLMRINSSLIYLLAPSFFIYVYARAGGRIAKWLYIVHIAPFIFILIYLIPFYVLSSSEKFDLYVQWRMGNRIDIIPTEVLYRFQQAIYSVWLLILLVRKRKLIDKLSLLISFSFLLIWLIDLVRFVFELQKGYLFIWYHFIAFLPLLIFFEIRFKSFRSKKKYSTSGMIDNKSKELAEMVKSLVTDEQLYKQPKISLARISERLNVHHNYVSQAVNSHFGIGFKDLINSMRVEEAKYLLMNKENDRLTFEAIAEMAGFNSVSSFNSSFKKYAGQTPSAFKRTATGGKSVNI